MAMLFRSQDKGQPFFEHIQRNDDGNHEKKECKSRRMGVGAESKP